MSHIKNVFDRTVAATTAAVLSFAFAGGSFVNVFADGPGDPGSEGKINLEESDMEVSIVGGPFAYTGQQICPSDLIITAWTDDGDVLLSKNTDYTFTCGANVQIGEDEDGGEIEISSVDGSLYTFESFKIYFSIWEHLQDLSYDITSIEKTYLDEDFKNPLTIGANVKGDISYVSSDPDVASVDDEGNVEILMPGDTVITAIADPYDSNEDDDDDRCDYGEGVASYTLKVNKKELVIKEDTIVMENKEYDGTTVAEVKSFEFDETGIDPDDIPSIDAIGTFEDANVGNNKPVSVTLDLDNYNAQYFTAGTYSATANITPFIFDDADITLSEETYDYSGEENKPNVNILVDLNGSGKYLTENEDFTVTYPEDMVNAGEKTIIVKGKGNFVTDPAEGVQVTYEVEPYALGSNNIILEYAAVKYDGSPKTPGVTVKVGDHVIDSNDYTVDYTNNTGVGNANVRVTAKDNKNIDGFADKTFEITNKQMLNISGISNQTVTYTGKPVVLAGNLTVTGGNITADMLDVTYYNEYGNKMNETPEDAGSYAVVYSYDKDNYIGSLRVEFTIAKAVSPTPPEMTANLTVEAGFRLNDIEDELTDGFWWDEPNTVVAQGNHTYAATYTYADDDLNYTTLHLNVPVYGIARVDINVGVDGFGGDVDYPDEAYEGDKVVINFLPEATYEIKSVLLNGMDVTSSVKDNKLSITVATTNIDVLVSYRRVYNVIDGGNLSYVVGSGSLATFRFDVDHDLFVNGGKVYVDGMLIGEGYYTHTSGSTIITLSESLIDLIGNGEHTIAVVFGDGGIARTDFSVQGVVENPVKTPDTGFFTGTIGGVRAISITALVFAGLFGIVVYRKKFAGKKVDFDKK